VHNIIEIRLVLADGSIARVNSKKVRTSAGVDFW
jgi:hypothetical protein